MTFQVTKRGLTSTLDENDREREAAGIGGFALAHYSTPDITATVERLSDGHTFTLYWRLMVTPNTTIRRDKTAQEIRLILNDLGIPINQGWVTDKDHEEAMEILAGRYNVAFTNKYKKS